MTTTAYHVTFTTFGTNVSGGETTLMNMVRHFAARGIVNRILTTDNGQRMLEVAGLKENAMVGYSSIPSFAFEQRHHPFVSYVRRTRDAVRFVKGLKLEPSDLIVCHNDFFPNSIPTWVLSRRHPATRVCYWFNMRVPGLFRGYLGEYTGKRCWPDARLVHYVFNQWLYKKTIRPGNLVLVQNPIYMDKLREELPGSRLLLIENFGGSDVQYVESAKEYDCAWMGRFHEQKGLLELPEILSGIKKDKPDFRILIMGDGDEGLKKEFFARVERAGLGGNVVYKGFVAGQERYRLLSQARTFLMTSYFESYGLVILEAMSLGLPVVAYDLPPFGVFKPQLHTVPVLDNAAFAREAVRLIRDEKAGVGTMEFARKFSWTNSFDQVLKALET